MVRYAKQRGLLRGALALVAVAGIATMASVAIRDHGVADLAGYHHETPHAPGWQRSPEAIDKGGGSGTGRAPENKPPLHLLMANSPTSATLDGTGTARSSFGGEHSTFSDRVAGMRRKFDTKVKRKLDSLPRICKTAPAVHRYLAEAEKLREDLIAGARAQRDGSMSPEEARNALAVLRQEFARATCRVYEQHSIELRALPQCQNLFQHCHDRGT